MWTESQDEGTDSRGERGRQEFCSLHGDADSRPEGGAREGYRGLLLLSLLIPSRLRGSNYLRRIGVGGQLMGYGCVGGCVHGEGGGVWEGVCMGREMVCRRVCAWGGRWCVGGCVHGDAERYQ